MLLLLLACRDADKTPIDSSLDSEVPVVDADDDGYPDTEDCDDSDPEVNPGAEELCEPAGRDEDCDGLIDDEDSDPIGQAEWYRDEDGDGLGDPEILVSACEAPEGFVDNADDCDDTRYLGDEDLDGEDDCSDDDIDGDGLRNEWDAGGLGCLRRRGSHARFRNGWAAPRSTSSPTPAG